jgi:O-acetylhomoserine/O-acetylserine sulfhydrylase-like pyridoxal-dependent enzyme
VLFAEEITSQTARILEVEPIGKWCRQKNVILVLDGTQQFDFTAPKE